MKITGRQLRSIIKEESRGYEEWMAIGKAPNNPWIIYHDGSDKEGADATKMFLKGVQGAVNGLIANGNGKVIGYATGRGKEWRPHFHVPKNGWPDHWKEYVKKGVPIPELSKSSFDLNKKLYGLPAPSEVLKENRSMKITRRQLKRLIKEEDYDCIRDCLGLGYSRRECRDQCRDSTSHDRHPLDVDGDGKLTVSEMKISLRQLRKIIKEELSRVTSEARYKWSSETGAVPREGVPWEFGPEGYSKRSELQAKMKGLSVGPGTDMVTMLKIALSNRAEEMIGYQKAVDPTHFGRLAQRIMKNYITDVGIGIDDKTQMLHSILTRIDAGDYFDEDIMDVQGWQGDAESLQINEASALSVNDVVTTIKRKYGAAVEYLESLVDPVVAVAYFIPCTMAITSGEGQTFLQEPSDPRNQFVYLEEIQDTLRGGYIDSWQYPFAVLWAVGHCMISKVSEADCPPGYFDGRGKCSATAGPPGGEMSDEGWKRFTEWERKAHERHRGWNEKMELLYGNEMKEQQ